MSQLLFPVVGGAVCWELLYGACGVALRRLAASPGVVLSDPGASKEKLARLGASYVVALVHALVVGLRGVWHVYALLDAPIGAKLAIPDASSPWHAAAAATETTNVLFLSWLLYDLAHVLLSFPALGAADTVAHHAGFICASAICGAHASAVRLRLAHRRRIVVAAAERAMAADPVGPRRVALLQRVNVGFALAFVAFRVALGAAGMAHLAVHRAALSVLDGVVPSALSRSCSSSSPPAGYSLNLGAGWARCEDGARHGREEEEIGRRRGFCVGTTLRRCRAYV